MHLPRYLIFQKFAFGLLELPKFTFIDALIGGGFKEINAGYIATVAFAYVPVAFVVFAEHIADHKNLSSIIGQDLTEDPGLHRTLLGDGVGSIAGALFGGCPNTTYGESVGCVAITGNASVVTIFANRYHVHDDFRSLPVRSISCKHSELRNGRCLHDALRLYRGKRSENDSGC